MDYFTADLHMGHENILKYEARGEWLKSALGRDITIQDHDQHVIDTLNHWVKPSDTLWILGDLSFWKSAYYTLSLVEQIECRHIRFISGNHDSSRIEQYRFCSQQKPGALFEAVHEFYHETKIGGRKYVLSHFPILDWNAGAHGSVMLHGHCHGNLDYHRFGIDKYRILDVGWDASFKTFGQYRPFSLDRIHDLVMHKEHFPHHGDAT